MLTAAGGQTPYAFSIASGAGTVDSTGLFTAPATAGDYDYICSFPGHSVMMKGILKVEK